MEFEFEFIQQASARRPGGSEYKRAWECVCECLGAEQHGFCERFGQSMCRASLSIAWSFACGERNFAWPGTRLVEG